MKQNITTPALQNIRIADPLFGHYADVIAQRLLPYQWEVLNDRIPDVEKSHCIHNFRVAAGECAGQRQGAVFCDTDAYKWLEALAYCLASGRGGQYRQTADELIDLIGRAQEPDGYLDTYYTVLHPDKKWTNLTEGHELYCAGHLMEAAVAYWQATGRDKILKIACRLADLICQVFGPGRHPGYPGHPELELALIRLSRATGDRKYALQAKYFLDIRGRGKPYLMEELRRTGRNRIFPEFSDYTPGYAQEHMPPAEQTTAEGHAVRAMYLYSAMADAAKEFSDPELKAACRTLWENITQRRMYITGGIGSSGHLERFTTDYDLPNDRMYCESCASVGLMMFGQRMAALTGDAGYYDIVERALCNTVLGGISAQGDRYFYVNPLEVWPDNCLPGTSMAHVKPRRQGWFGVACCPANIARTLASVGQYIFAQDEKSIYINQFISASLTAVIRDTEIRLELQSQLMHGGTVRLTIDSSRAQPFTIRIRIPHYWREPVFVLEGKTISPVIENGYAVVAVSYAGQQTLTVSGSLTPEWVAACDSVRADVGQVALVYGPYVYCLEQADNGTRLPGLFVAPDTRVRTGAPIAGLPGEMPTLHFEGMRLSSGVDGSLYGSPRFALSPQSLTAVPYGLWCNREPGEMQVWLKTLQQAPEAQGQSIRG